MRNIQSTLSLHGTFLPISCPSRLSTKGLKVEHIYIYFNGLNMLFSLQYGQFFIKVCFIRYMTATPFPNSLRRTEVGIVVFPYPTLPRRSTNPSQIICWFLTASYHQANHFHHAWATFIILPRRKFLVINTTFSPHSHCTRLFPCFVIKSSHL